MLILVELEHLVRALFYSAPGLECLYGSPPSRRCGVEMHGLPCSVCCWGW